jgi:hypothetical protein
MMFNIEWVIQNPIQTIDKGVSVIFDSEPILLAATIITFCIVAFFVWNKNKIKLYKMVEDRKPMEPVKFDREDILELKSALGKATISEDVRSPVKLSERPFAKGQVPPKERTKTSGEAERIDDKGSDTAADEPHDELLDWFVEQYTDDKQEQKEMKKMPETNNEQHTYESGKKIDKRKTPEFKARLLENLRKARERKRLEKAGREVPEKP